MKLYEVGGAVRDKIMGIASKDVDFVAVASSYEEMRDTLVADGFEIFVEKPEYVTIRAKVPEGNKLRERTNVADFVLARKDGPSSDGRRPDFVEPGTLEDDLARRDFTINAIAMTPEGYYIDPFNGRVDIQNKVLRFVGKPEKRIAEDGLRVMRALRFFVTKELAFDPATWRAINSTESACMLGKVSIERVREELEKMFAHNTLHSLLILNRLTHSHKRAIFRDGLRLSATLKG